jgi:hypothetical protein
LIAVTELQILKEDSMRSGISPESFLIQPYLTD